MFDLIVVYEKGSDGMWCEMVCGFVVFDDWLVCV